MSGKTFLCTVLVVLATAACEQRSAAAVSTADADTERAAYSAALRTLIRPSEARAVVLDHPIAPTRPDTVRTAADLQWLSERLPGLERATLEAFVARQSEPVSNWRRSVGADSTVTFVDSAQAGARIDSVRWADPVIERQVEFLSVAGFNPARTQALVYAGYDCGPMCAGEFYIMLVRAPGSGWRVQKTFRTFAS